MRDAVHAGEDRRHARYRIMIFIVIRIEIRPEKRDDFLAGIVRYSAQVREEPGNLHFTCYQSVEQADEFVVVANYSDPAAGAAHVASEHAKWFFGWLPSVVSRVPRIVYQELPPGTEWTEMGEVRMTDRVIFVPTLGHRPERTGPRKRPTADPSGRTHRELSERIDETGRVRVSDRLDACERSNVVVVSASAGGRRAGGRPISLAGVLDSTVVAAVAAWVRSGGPGITEPPVDLRRAVFRPR